jgi:hypothetical protein
MVYTFQILYTEITVTSWGGRRNWNLCWHCIKPSMSVKMDYICACIISNFIIWGLSWKVYSCSAEEEIPPPRFITVFTKSQQWTHILSHLNPSYTLTAKYSAQHLVLKHPQFMFRVRGTYERTVKIIILYIAIFRFQIRHKKIKRFWTE